MLLLLGILEFGFVFDEHLTIEYSSREGARVGAALADGSSTVPCAEVDGHIVAAVQRVLTSPGSRVKADQVGQIRIYKATSTGAQQGGLVNVWTYQSGGGPTVDGKAQDGGLALLFGNEGDAPGGAGRQGNLGHVREIGSRPSGGKLSASDRQGRLRPSNGCRHHASAWPADSRWTS